ncbi:hypothetical protein F5X99DRAFT_185759 [Biscogniauxia marginata]|nr:hypothetical protein F5X99DRAFT_185759 [Biscogniauxia marginata]
MLASAEAVASPATPALYFEPLYDHSPPSKLSQPSFKRHKVLPHPKNHRPVPAAASTGQLSSRSLSVDTAAISRLDTTKPSTPPGLKKGTQSIRILGPDLPPTPPAHSRTSSSSYSILPSSPTYVESPARSVATNPVRSVPGTPPNQRSPPTPDVTPPQPERRPKSYRPVQTDRFPSKGTADSRTESFKTAREDPDSSEEDDKTTPKPFPSSRTSQITVRRPADLRPKNGTPLPKTQDVGLGLGLESDDSLTPRTKQEFFTFDGEWGSTSEVEQEWDDNLNRNVVVRKRRTPPKFNGRKTEEVIEDVTVTPTNATKALRSRPLQERLHTQPSPLPQEFMSRDKHSTAPSTSESSISTDIKRSSAMSSKSTTSTTVVEAILVDTPPQRLKRLRHVRKQTALRDSSSEISAPSSVATSLGQAERISRSRTLGRHDTARTESILSTGTINSVASRKARREVWKNGGIPVVVIPGRNASLRSSGPPSLRSTASHRSKRSNSLSAVPSSSRSREIETPPYFERPPRRERALSESDGLNPPFLPEQLTMDYPPIAPRRRSSLSAPTSRNTSRSRSLPGSRSASLTAESMKAHNGPIDQEAKRQPPQVAVEHVHPVEDTNTHSDRKQLQPAPFIELHREVPSDQKPLVDHNGDPFFGKRLTAHNTPFSQASVETNGTHSIGDISEAMAVNIYPHQNRSVLMVHHMSKPADPANALQIEGSAKTDGSVEIEKISGNPEITTSGPDGGPVTPPRPQFSLVDVDSPLRNPRAPPEPPAIKFTPATPSGLTPTAEKEKMLGNYFEETQKRPSLVRRAFSLHKNPGSTASRGRGFFARTLSLSKTIRRDTAENPDLEKAKKAILPQHPAIDDPLHEEDRLHPFWRPASESDGENEEGDEDDYVHDMPDEVEKVYRYPRFDKHPRRSLSERMKRTFAILPVDDDDHYDTTDHRGPERRTIKRTPSGNLRVMRYRDSYGSLRWSNSFSRDDQEGRPSTAPDRPNHRVWGVEKRVDDRGRRIFPGWQEKLGQYRPQNLQRRLSEHRRQKRTDALRQKISGPREVRDGVGEVVSCQNYKGSSYEAESTSRSRATENGRYAHDPELHRQETQAL